VPIKIWLVSMHKGRTLRETPLSLLTSLLRVGCSLVQLTSGTEAARAQTPDDSAAVAGVVEHYHSALAKGDGAAALGHLAEDAVVVESGIIESREEYRSHHLPAEIGFTRAVKEIRSPVRVKIQGDVAWATATSRTRGSYHRRRVNSTGAELMVLSRFPDGWIIRAIHWSSHNRPDE
jgi:ketosteroid isomerase-like protein